MSDRTELIRKLAYWMGWEAPTKGQYWKYADKPDGFEYFTGYMQPDAEQGKIWNPLTRIKDAWLLVEKLRRDGHTFEIGYDAAENQWWTRIRGLFSIADTLPAAICATLEKLIEQQETPGIPFKVIADQESVLGERPDLS